MTIYLDHNATTPVDPEVREAMLPLLGEVYGNPSSIHRPGQRARRVLDQAREQVATLVGAEPEEIIFTSGGTESIHLALRGSFPVGSTAGAGLATSTVEHQAVLGAAHALGKRGVATTWLAVDSHGMVSLDQLATALTPDTRLVSVMLANNDVGTVQPIQAIAAAAAERGLRCHSDATQAVGKIPVAVRDLGLDMLSFSAHKIHGPKGAGALWLRKGMQLEPLLAGGHQESLRRAGTENLPGIAGFGRACALAAERLDSDAQRLASLRDRLQQRILSRLPGARVNGHPSLRLPGTLSVSLPGVDAELLLMALDLQGVAASTGSACTADSQEPSHVLTAMGLSSELARSTLRLSLGHGNTGAQVDEAVEILVQVVAQVGGFQGGQA